MPGEWAQQDLVQKSAILQTLYSKIDDLSTDDRPRGAMEQPTDLRKIRWFGCHFKWRW